MEIEFIDTEAVDELLNLNANAAEVRAQIAAAIAKVCVAKLKTCILESLPAANYKIFGFVNRR